MLIKIKDNAINISGWLVLAGLLVADNIYANHCRRKAMDAICVNVVDEPTDQEEEEAQE